MLEVTILRTENLANLIGGFMSLLCRWKFFWDDLSISMQILSKLSVRKFPEGPSRKGLEKEGSIGTFF